MKMKYTKYEIKDIVDLSFCDFFDFDLFKQILLRGTDNSEVKNANSFEELTETKWLNETINDLESRYLIQEYLEDSEEEFLWFWSEEFKEFHVYKSLKN